jgi:hypothetical protein
MMNRSLALLVVAVALVAGAGARDVHAALIHSDTAYLTPSGRPEPNNATPITIPVCWATPGFDAEKRTIRDAVTRTWGRVAPLDFTNWGDCPPLMFARLAFVKIQIFQASDSAGGGNAPFGRIAVRAAWEQPAVTFFLQSGMASDRVRYIGIHEFGHILGFVHEDDSPWRAAGCATQTPWTNVIQLGPWDRQSVMNSGCNPYGNNIGYLSPLDREGVRRLYGTRKVVNHGDFDGDSTADFGVWRPSTGQWFVPAQSSTWGAPDDKPVPGDYDGDGTTNPAVWKPSTGEWWVRDGSAPVQWGQLGDIPVPGDYNGDGRTDRAVWRPSDGVWYVNARIGPWFPVPPVQWGQVGDIPVPGDYDGDGVTDRAVWRPSNGIWYIATNSGNFQLLYGQAGDIPVPGDYVGEGKVRPAVFRPSEGRWWFPLQPIAYPTWSQVWFGQAGDVPFAASLSGNGIDEIAVWRSAVGAFIPGTGLPRIFAPTDVPVTSPVR